MKLELSVKRIEMNEITIRKIMIMHKLKDKFRYMQNYKIILNNNIEDNKCRLVYTNGLSQIMNMDI